MGRKFRRTDVPLPLDPTIGNQFAVMKARAFQCHPRRMLYDLYTSPIPRGRMSDLLAVYIRFLEAREPN